MNRRQFLKIGGTYVFTLTALSQGACQLTQDRETDTLRRLILLYTNDEHGWMEPYQTRDGAAGMMHIWRVREGYEPGDSRFLVLSGGDMWTGPALSTAHRGASMTEVMNAMGYQAAAIGNHDFDFELDVLRERAREAEFPFLAANLVYRDTGEVPEFAKPYLIRESNGVRVGILGLSTRETMVDTKPEAVQSVWLLDYEDTLRKYVPEMREQGAQLIVLITHLCAHQTEALAGIAQELDIHIIAGGHCHQEINEQTGDVRRMESGYFMRGYVRIEILYDREKEEILEAAVEIIPNRTIRRDREILDIMAKWEQALDPDLKEEIGYLSKEIDRRSPEMDQVVLGSWLAAFPEVDVAFATRRYMQQDLYQGVLTPAAILSVLATDNELYIIEMNGDQILDTLQEHQTMVMGLHEEDGSYYLQDGSPLSSEGSYSVIVPHNLYYGGYYFEFDRYDGSPVATGVNWRNPVIHWIREQHSTVNNPLDRLLQAAS